MATATSEYNLRQTVVSLSHLLQSTTPYERLHCSVWGILGELISGNSFKL